jgi:hypothetical protein
VTGAGAHARKQQRMAAFQIDEIELAARFPAQQIAVGALQGGAGYDDPLPLGARGGNIAADARQPRPAVVIGERRAPGHFLHVFGRVQAIALDEGEPQALRQKIADRRFATAAHTHNNHRQWRLFGLLAHACSCFPRRPMRAGR